MPAERTVEEQEYQMLTEGEPINRHLYHPYGLLPQIRAAERAPRHSGARAALSCICSAGINPNTIPVSASLVKNLIIPAAQQ